MDVTVKQNDRANSKVANILSDMNNSLPELFQDLADNYVVLRNLTDELERYMKETGDITHSDILVEMCKLVGDIRRIMWKAEDVNENVVNSIEFELTGTP